jgi:N-methylhydantoinase A
LSLPALDIHTVGAGGGSIAWRDPGGALRVGPASAGASPGPACYGRGGASAGEAPATVTDANLILGRLLEDSPLAGGLSLDRSAAVQAVSRVAQELRMDLMACAEGIVRVAEAEMRGALRLMTVERGIDPRGFVLMAFGGAGPLHAAALADELGIERVLCPRASGVLCALGLAAAAPRRDVSRTVMLSGDSLTSERLAGERDALLAEARSALGEVPARVRVRHELRYRGQSFELAVEESEAVDPEVLGEAFAEAHELRYGYRDDAAAIELVNIRVSVWGPSPPLPELAADAPVPAPDTRPIVFDGRSVDAEVFRGELPPGMSLSGPALCALPDATLLVPPGWSGEVDLQGTIHLRHTIHA